MTPQLSMRLVLSGQLSADLAEWLEPLQAVALPDGRTELTGVLADQSAVHSICNRLRDLGLPLDSLNVEKEYL